MSKKRKGREKETGKQGERGRGRHGGRKERGRGIREWRIRGKGRRGRLKGVNWGKDNSRWRREAGERGFKAGRRGAGGGLTEERLPVSVARQSSFGTFNSS